MQGPLAVKIEMVVQIPQSKSKREKALMLSGEIKPTIKPDVDNAVKAILDALNGVAFPDDKAVTTLFVKKRYGATPGVLVEIEEEKDESEGQAAIEPT